MYEDAATVLLAKLGPGERLLWQGQPRQGIVLRAADVFLVPFSVLWCGFAIFWEVMALSMATKEGLEGPGIFFPLFGIPFVIVGLYFVFGRFWVDARRRASIFYGVTNERVVIVSGVFSRETKSLSLRTLTDVSLSEKADGRGTITFGPASPFAWMSGAMWWPGMGGAQQAAFEIIENAKGAYDLVREAQKAAS